MLRRFASRDDAQHMGFGYLRSPPYYFFFCLLSNFIGEGVDYQRLERWINSSAYFPLSEKKRECLQKMTCRHPLFG